MSDQQHARIRDAQRLRRGYCPVDAGLDRSLRSLQMPCARSSLFAITCDWLTIVGAAIVSWKVFVVAGVTPLSVALYLLACFVIGSRQKGLENLMHEGTHFNLSRHRRLNDAMAIVMAGLWLAPGWTPKRERPGHVGRHHENFGQREQDGEFFGYQQIGLGHLPAESASRSVRILVRAFLRTTYWRLHGTAVSLGVTRTILVVTAVLAIGGGAPAMVLYWLVPYFAVYMPMRFLAEVSEHMALGHGSEFSTSRNKLGWFQEYLMHPHGDGYHLVHHLYPRIPHQNLARAHRLLMRDPVYRAEGNHCHGFVFTRRGRTTLGDLLRQGMPSLSPS